MSLKLITLKTNHTLLGDVDDTSFEVTIKKPVQVIGVPPSPQNPQGGIAFSPFVEYAEEFVTGFTLNRDDILFFSTPVKELINQYNDIFGSGIQIATSLPR